MPGRINKSNLCPTTKFFCCVQSIGNSDSDIVVLANLNDRIGSTYAPESYNLPELSLAVQDGINSTSGSSFATHDALLYGNEFSPYSTLPYPTINFTHGDASLYLEKFPCTVTVNNLPVGAYPGGTDVTTAQYSDLVEGLTGLKALLENGVSIDKGNDRDISLVNSLPPKSQQPQYGPLSSRGSPNLIA